MIPKSATFSLVRHELRERHRTRSLLLAIILGGALVVIAAIVGATLSHRADTGAGVNYAGADLLVRSAPGTSVGVSTSGDDTQGIGSNGISSENIATIAGFDGVTHADGLTRSRAGLWTNGAVTPTIIESLPSEPFRWQRLDKGHYPQSATEVALSTATMDSTGLHLGDVVTIATDEAGDGQFTIVGAVDTRGALDYESTDYALVTPELAQAFAGTSGANEVRVALAPGADPREVIDQINAKVPGGWPETTATLIASTKTVYTIGLGALTTLVNGFAVVAALVSLTVLGTVVWASLPERRRQLALMRLVGASRGQLMSVLILESAVVALIGGILALPVGIGCALLSFPALGAIPGVPSIPWSQVTIPVVPMIAVPIIAVIGAIAAVATSAINAGRVPPSDALRRSVRAEQARPYSATVHLLSVLALALITAVAPLIGGAKTTAIAAAFFLIALVLAVPTLCRIGASIFATKIGNRHPLAEISSAEIQSFPGRTAATGMAAMLAAAIMSLSWVALASVSSVADARSNDDPGAQIMVGAYAGQAPLDPVVVEALGAIDGIGGVVPVNIGQVRLSGTPPENSPSPGAITRLNKGIVAGSAEDFAHLTGNRFPLEHSAPDVVYLPASGQTPFRDGSSVTLSGPTGERVLTVRYIPDLPLPGLVTPNVMAEVGISTSSQAVWLSVSDNARRGDVLDSAQVVATIGGDLPITGSTVTDVKVDSIVHTAQRIATAMLSVSVIIAVVGAVVTLSSSLRDRASEFAVLRLLGMEGSQLRKLVGAETVIVGAVSVVMGLVAGALVGAVASVAIADGLGVDSHITIPFLVLVAMGVATVIGLRIATTGPIDHVSLVPPAVALRSANFGGKQ